MNFFEETTIFAIDLPHEQLKTKNMYTVDFLKTLHAEDDFVDAIRERIQDFPRHRHSEIVSAHRPHRQDTLRVR